MTKVNNFNCLVYVRRGSGRRSKKPLPSIWNITQLRAHGEKLSRKEGKTIRFDMQCGNDRAWDQTLLTCKDGYCEAGLKGLGGRKRKKRRT